MSLVVDSLTKPVELPLVSDRGVRAAWMYFVTLMVAYGAVILVGRMPPPLVDYPDWVFQGVLLRSVLAGHPVPGYALKAYPVPNSLTTVGLGLMDGVLPWAWAAKVWICGYLGLATIVSWRLMKVSGVRDWRMIVALPSVLFLDLDFWYGHTSFEIGLCLFLLFASVVMREGSTVALGGLLVLLFFTHMEACACALLLLVLAAHARGKRRCFWAATPTLLLTIWYALGRYLSGNADGRSVAPAAYRYGSPAFVAYKANTFLKPFGYVHARAGDGSSQTVAIIGAGGLLLLLTCALVIAGCCFWMLLRRQGFEDRPDHRLLRQFAWVALVIAAVLPQVVFGVADPGSRLVLAGVAMGLFAVKWARTQGSVIALCSVVLSLGNLWQFVRIEANPEISGVRARLPGEVLAFAHVEPGMRVHVYAEMERGEMKEPIFQTGIFRLVPKENGRSK